VCAYPLLRANVLNFQVKMQILCIFIEKNYLCLETETGGGLIDPLGAEDIKRTGEFHFGGYFFGNVRDKTSNIRQFRHTWRYAIPLVGQ